MIAMLLFAAALGSAPKTLTTSAPLPDPKTLLEKAIDNDKKMAEEQERYTCTLTHESRELDKAGKVTATHSSQMQQFFVNGNEIDRVLARNGKPLTPEEKKKQDERVNKETVKYSDPKYKKKADDADAKTIEEIIHLNKVSNERRGTVNGRSTIFFDIHGNQDAKPDDMIGKYIVASGGTMSVDETTGEIVDYNIKTDKTVRLALGLLNTPKGFWFHIYDAPQPDGVWLTELQEGSGVATLGFFMHKNFNFKDTTSNCKLYTVQTTTEVSSASK